MKWKGKQNFIKTKWDTFSAGRFGWLRTKPQGLHFQLHLSLAIWGKEGQKVLSSLCTLVFMFIKQGHYCPESSWEHWEWITTHKRSCDPVGMQSIAFSFQTHFESTILLLQWLKNQYWSIKTNTKHLINSSSSRVQERMHSSSPVYSHTPWLPLTHPDSSALTVHLMVHLSLPMQRQTDRHLRTDSDIPRYALGGLTQTLQVFLSFQVLDLVCISKSKF